ncbi:MAG: hypothetical protein IT443_07435 [Phycisphaeraceae bacterium]|nr:hypothetical protein [Phycisphaeraceae bacterium]
MKYANPSHTETLAHFDGFGALRRFWLKNEVFGEGGLALFGEVRQARSMAHFVALGLDLTAPFVLWLALATWLVLPYANLLGGLLCLTRIIIVDKISAWT